MKLLCPTPGCNGVEADIRFFEYVEVTRKILGIRPDGTIVVDLYETRTDTDGDSFGFCCVHCGATWAAEELGEAFKGFDFSDEFRAPEHATKAVKPLASTVEVAVWDERDRLHIHAFVGDENHTVAEWWDDEAHAMIESGFFTYDVRPGLLGTHEVGPKLVKSVRAYLVDVGLAKEG